VREGETGSRENRVMQLPAPARKGERSNGREQREKDGERGKDEVGMGKGSGYSYPVFYLIGRRRRFLNSC
jgi:hypothetical protein